MLGNEKGTGLNSPEKSTEYRGQWNKLIHAILILSGQSMPRDFYPSNAVVRGWLVDGNQALH